MKFLDTDQKMSNGLEPHTIIWHKNENPSFRLLSTLPKIPY